MNNYSASTAAAAHIGFPFSRRNFDGRSCTSLLALSRDLRSKTMFAQALQGKSVAMIFEKPSLRTRVTFEVAIRQLGGWPVMLGTAESRLGEREPIQDLARNLSCWVDGIVARVFRHEDLEDLALFAIGSGDQRAERSRASVPGPGRHAYALRHLADVCRQGTCLHRRLEQCFAIFMARLFCFGLEVPRDLSREATDRRRTKNVDWST